MVEEKAAMRRVGLYLEQEVLDLCDSLLGLAAVRSRNEFVGEALRFYCGYLTSKKAEDYLLEVKARNLKSLSFNFLPIKLE